MTTNIQSRRVTAGERNTFTIIGFNSAQREGIGCKGAQRGDVTTAQPDASKGRVNVQTDARLKKKQAKVAVDISNRSLPPLLCVSDVLLLLLLV